MYLISDNGDYPRFIGDLQLAHPEWSEGDDLPAGWVEVAEGELPEISENQVWEEVKPALIDGVMTRQFTVRDLTADELAQRELARIRGKVMNNEPLTAVEAALLVGE